MAENITMIIFQLCSPYWISSPLATERAELQRLSNISCWFHCIFLFTVKLQQKTTSYRFQKCEHALLSNSQYLFDDCYSCRNNNPKPIHVDWLCSICLSVFPCLEPVHNHSAQWWPNQCLSSKCHHLSLMSRTICVWINVVLQSLALSLQGKKEANKKAMAVN